MEKKKSFCLKHFGFMPTKEMSRVEKKNKAGRKASERYYLKDLSGVYLTSREFEISLFVASGCTVKETASKLELSPRTVEYYLTNVRRKLGVRNKQELVKMLFDNGLL